MKHIWVASRAGVWLAALAVLAGMVPQAALADGGDLGRVLLRPRVVSEVLAIANDHGAQVLRLVGEDGYFSVRPVRGQDVLALVRSLKQDERVGSAEPVGWVTIPEIRGDQLAFAFDVGPDPGDYWNQYAWQQVRLGDAHDTAQGRGIRIAVLDTGCADHPDLQGRVLPGYNAIEPSQPPLDVPAPPEADISVMGIRDAGAGHGTMVCGVIAVGAPRAKIIPVKVLSADGTGTVEDVVEGIYWAIRHGADIISMSFGSPVGSEAVEDAIRAARRAGIVLVASAGNDSTDVPHTPASLAGVLSVSAVESDNAKSPYASFGKSVDIVAPGSGIRSTFWDGGYATWSGTSFAVPFVTAAAALVMELQEHAGPARITNILKGTATSVDEQNPGYIGMLGDGLLDIARAVRRAD
jgi:subtilisin family serine protease